MDVLTDLDALVVAHAVPALILATTALVVLAGLGWAVWRLVRGRPADEVLTPIAALAATAVAMTGMWNFFGDVLGASGLMRVGLFAFLELAMVTSAVRARRNVIRDGTAGVDGAAVWVITGLSAVLSATDADSFRAALLRFAAPLLAAWLWERGLAVERRRGGHAQRINYRITPDRILVRLGIAEAGDRTATEVEVHRRLTRLARAANHVRRLRAAGAKPRTLRRALRRLDRAMDGAVEHTDLAGDPRRRDELLNQIAALYHAPALADLTPATPWTTLGPAAGTVPALPPATEATRTDETRTDAPTQQTPPRTNRPRTNPGPAARTAKSRTGTPVDRDRVVAGLVEEIHAAMDAGTRWTPNYPALMELTGYRRSWCEKAVRDARNLARRTQPAPDSPAPAARTDAPGAGADGPDGAEAGTVIELARTAGE